MPIIFHRNLRNITKVLARLAHGTCLLSLLIILSGFPGCEDGKKKTEAEPPDVSVVTLKSEAVPLSAELPGRTSPYAIADIQPQISGIIRARLFVEGANVKAGQPLYQIDPELYQATFDQAKATLAYAVANIRTTKLKAERYADLLKIKGESQQDFDDADAAYHQAVALVAEDKAALETARINLRYTRIDSPISGRTGTSNFTQGALVSVDQTNDLTTVQTLDPIYVDITQSTTELLKLRRSLAVGALANTPATIAGIKLKLEDGSDYAQEGKLELTDITVDQTTGSVRLRAVFANPDGILLPGMYVRAIVPEGVNPSGLLVPEQGVSHDLKGQAVVMLVDGDGKAQSQPVETTKVLGNKWLVSKGVKEGDRIIVEGLQKVKTGMAVHVVQEGEVKAAQETPPDSPEKP